MKEKRRCSICQEWFETDKDYISCPAHSFGETSTPMNQNPNTNKEVTIGQPRLVSEEWNDKGTITRKYEYPVNINKECACNISPGSVHYKNCPLVTPSPKDWESDFREYFDKTLKPKKPAMGNLDRELCIDFIRQERTNAQKEIIEIAIKEVEELETIKGSTTDGFKAVAVYRLSHLLD